MGCANKLNNYCIFDIFNIINNMDDFLNNYVNALSQLGISVQDEENSTPMSREDLLRSLKNRTLCEIDGKWYTHDSLPWGAEESFTGETIIVDSLTYYWITDCIVSGLCIAEINGKFGLIPLQERTGTQHGIWSCKGDPFVYDEVIVYADWNLWPDYGFVAARKDSFWGVIKVVQFPEPMIEVVSDFSFKSSKEAMKNAGINKMPKKAIGNRV